MATKITLESVKREMNIHFGLRTVFEVVFSFQDDTVAGTIMVPIPPENVTDGELVTRTREHIHSVFLRLAEEVIRPQEAFGTEADIEPLQTTVNESTLDPSEVAAERRREEIAAAKLLIAVSLYANGTVPAADRLPPAREDSEGVSDMERYMPEVSDMVMKSMPDGFGGVRKSLNLHVARWLIEGKCFDADKDVVTRTEKAIAAIGTQEAKSYACQALWNTLMSYAR